MSFNQPPPQPGYGAPQQPNPYGQPQQPAPGQPGQGQGQYGYPQQPQPGAPYGQPGFPQQPGQPAGWSTAPPPPPPGGGGKGKVIGIVVGAVAVVAAIGVGVSLMVGGGGDSYKLSMPASILSGKYAKGTTQPSQTPTKTVDGLSNATTVEAQYGQTGGEMYTISGLYGDVSDPNGVVDKMLQALSSNSSDAPVKVDPPGFDGTVMKCGLVAPKMPFCVWGDDSTVALVMYSDTSQAALTGTEAAKYPTVQDFAKDVATIRSEVRVEK